MDAIRRGIDHRLQVGRIGIDVEVKARRARLIRHPPDAVACVLIHPCARRNLAGPTRLSAAHSARDARRGDPATRGSEDEKQVGGSASSRSVRSQVGAQSRKRMRGRFRTAQSCTYRAMALYTVRRSFGNSFKPESGLFNPSVEKPARHPAAGVGRNGDNVPGETIGHGPSRFALCRFPAPPITLRHCSAERADRPGTTGFG